MYIMAKGTMINLDNVQTVRRDGDRLIFGMVSTNVEVQMDSADECEKTFAELYHKLRREYVKSRRSGNDGT